MKDKQYYMSADSVFMTCGIDFHVCQKLMQCWTKKGS